MAGPGNGGGTAPSSLSHRRRGLPRRELVRQSRTPSAPVPPAPAPRRRALLRWDALAAASGEVEVRAQVDDDRLDRRGRVLARLRQVVVRDDGLDVALELGLGARRTADDPAAAVEAQ